MHLLRGGVPCSRALATGVHLPQVGAVYRQRLAQCANWHPLRIAARAQLLGPLRATGCQRRRDAKGFASSDVEAQSEPYWRQCVASLLLDEATALRIWKQGATGTPTRRQRGASEGLCPCCPGTFCSARHFVGCLSVIGGGSRPH